MAKRLVTDTAFKVANDALQLLGGYGYLADYGIEKIVRDLRVHQILEGTNEIMRVIVARALLAERAMTDVAIRIEGRAGRITLTRPQALNALTHAMVARDRRRARRLGATTRRSRWCSSTPRARAPSAPAATSPRSTRAGRPRRLRLRPPLLGRRVPDERQDRPLSRSPYVALMQGFVMGGGVGVAGHGSHRVVGESAAGRHARMRRSA